MPTSIAIVALGPDQRAESAAVLCEAFHDYPVMRSVFAGAQGVEYDRRLRLLVDFTTEARHLRGDVILGAVADGRVAGVATVVRPGTLAPPALLRRRERLWAALGESARRAYEDFGLATEAFATTEPHFHLSMLGVRREMAGRGLGRLLLDAVHGLSAADVVSRGVSLTTESPDNVSLYEHFGYRVVGHASLAGYETWGFFRPDDEAGAGS